MRSWRTGLGGLVALSVGSILTAGLTQGVLDISGVGAVTPGTGLGTNFANAAQAKLIKAAIKVV